MTQKLYTYESVVAAIEKIDDSDKPLTDALFVLASARPSVLRITVAVATALLLDDAENNTDGQHYRRTLQHTKAPPCFLPNDEIITAVKWMICNRDREADPGLHAVVAAINS